MLFGSWDIDVNIVFLDRTREKEGYGEIVRLTSKGLGLRDLANDFLPNGKLGQRKGERLFRFGERGNGAG